MDTHSQARRRPASHAIGRAPARERSRLARTGPGRRCPTRTRGDHATRSTGDTGGTFNLTPAARHSRAGNRGRGSALLFRRRPMRPRAFGLIPRCLPTPLLGFCAPQMLLVLLRRLLVGGAGLGESDGDRLLAVFDLLAARLWRDDLDGRAATIRMRKDCRGSDRIAVFDCRWQDLCLRLIVVARQLFDALDCRGGRRTSCF
jgi:hypothetical protein